MILATRHTGLVVRDMERSLSFYRDLLGLRIASRSTESGAYIEQVVGIPGAVLDWVKLKADDGSLIELIQYRSPSPRQEVSSNAPSDRLGCSHIALTVRDIDILHDTLVKNGYMCNCTPQQSPDGRVKVMYCHDSDGIILEFVQELTA